MKAFILLLNTHLNADKKLVKSAVKAFSRVYYKTILAV